MKEHDCEKCIHHSEGVCTCCTPQTKAEFAKEIMTDTLEAVIAQSRIIGVVKPVEEISDEEWKNVERTVNIEHRLFAEKVVQSLISKVFEEAERYE